MEIHKIVFMFLTPSKSQVPFPALFVVVKKLLSTWK